MGLNAGFAPRYTVDAPTTAGEITTIAGGEPVTVHGITISNPTGANIEVNIRTTDGNTTTFYYIESDRSELFNVETPFLADKGIEIVNVSGGLLNITVYHSNPGL